MQPAWSIVVFTTAAGAGYGLLAVAGLLAALGRLPPDPGLAWPVLGLALGLITVGLLASVAHLGRPERGWRALSQWRSSWLSREGVAALATYAAAIPFTFGWAVLGTTGGLTALTGLASAALAIVTVVCSGMIYASLKPIAQWHNGWVVPVYLALAGETGLLWFTALAAVRGQPGRWLPLVTCLMVAIAFALKEGYWRHTARPAASTPATATGLNTFGRVRLLEAPHTESNYLLREMGYRVARRHARRLRRITRILAFALPLLLSLLVLAAVPPTAVLALVAALSASAGVLIERWLFFAQARHTVMLYYGAEAA